MPHLLALRSSAIYYTIKAELDVQGDFSKDPKTKCSFQLLQRPTGVQAMPLHAQEDVQITGCCCISKGAVMVQADAGTNIVRAGDSLGVTVQVRAAADDTGAVVVSPDDDARHARRRHAVMPQGAVSLLPFHTRRLLLAEASAPLAPSSYQTEVA
jgi:hypothetical protein